MDILAIKNDKVKIERMVFFLSLINKIEPCETETGKEFFNTMNAALEEHIKPFGREAIIKLNILERECKERETNGNKPEVITG